MITLIIAFAAGGGTFAASHFVADCGVGWSIFFGVLAFGVVQGVAAYFIRKRMTAEMSLVQDIMLNGQKKLQEKVQRWRFRPPSSQKEAEKEMLADMRTFVREAIAQVDGLARYKPWVPMVERQMATAKLQMHWMIREFDEVDRLMPKVLMLDPSIAAIKMARMYTKGEKSEDIGKVYAKTARRLRYNQNVLLAATWSWILVKRDDLDGAFKVLTEALKNSDDETLKRNHEMLMNNRPAHFSNSGIGDQWYSLFLEEPRVRNQRQHIQYR